MSDAVYAQRASRDAKSRYDVFSQNNTRSFGERKCRIVRFCLSAASYKTAREVFDVAGSSPRRLCRAGCPMAKRRAGIRFPPQHLEERTGTCNPSGRTARAQPELPPYDLYEIAPGRKPADNSSRRSATTRSRRSSYAAFQGRRDAGKIAPGTRFQVSLPTPFATIGARIVPEQVSEVLPAFEQHYFREVATIAHEIPHSDLAIQWDIAVEIIQALLGNRPGLTTTRAHGFLCPLALARAVGSVPADAFRSGCISATAIPTAAISSSRKHSADGDVGERHSRPGDAAGDTGCTCRSP